MVTFETNSVGGMRWLNSRYATMGGAVTRSFAQLNPSNALVMMAIGAVVLLPSLLRAQSRPSSRDQWVQLSAGVRFLTRETTTVDGLIQRIFASEINLCERSIGLRTSAQQPDGQTVSSYGQSVSALVAINGDYFNLSNHRPQGPTQSRGVRWRTDGWTHHDSLLTIEEDGRVDVRDVQGSGVPAMQQLLQTIHRPVRDFISVRERVLQQGLPKLSPHIEHDGRRHPRTGVGLSADRRTLWMVVIDGRTVQSAGATVEELTETLRSLGATDGLKLDGGGSSAMYIEGRGVVNHPSDGQERVVANHLGVLRLSQPRPRAWCPVAAR